MARGPGESHKIDAQRAFQPIYSRECRMIRSLRNDARNIRLKR